MRRITSLAELAAVEEPLHLALGVFDGVHLGHQAVIGTAVSGVWCGEPRVYTHPEAPLMRVWGIM